MPDIQETASRRDLSRADLIKAEDELVVAQRELQEMLGRAPLELVAIKHDFVPQPLTPPTEAGWMAMAMRSEEHTSELQSLMRISYAVFCLKKKNNNKHKHKISYIRTSTTTK